MYRDTGRSVATVNTTWAKGGTQSGIPYEAHRVGSFRASSNTVRRNVVERANRARDVRRQPGGREFVRRDGLADLDFCQHRGLRPGPAAEPPCRTCESWTTITTNEPWEGKPCESS